MTKSRESEKYEYEGIVRTVSEVSSSLNHWSSGVVNVGFEANTGELISVEYWFATSDAAKPFYDEIHRRIESNNGLEAKIVIESDIGDRIAHAAAGPLRFLKNEENGRSSK